ncbi:MAG TPA: hypothetical protein PKA98_09195 [Acidimicrobiales bacterium]|nr:hypothetical protein [Acidimicrobiales bacterium]
MPIRPGDTVQFIGPGPDPTPDAWGRNDPEGAPRPGDFGDVEVVDASTAVVKWRFGATTSTQLAQLAKMHPRSAPHLYSVLFEGMKHGEDVTYSVITEGGEAKAVWMASAALSRDHPNNRAFAVEVEDLGEPTGEHADALLAWDEVS